MHGDYKPSARIDQETIDAVRDAARQGSLSGVDPAIVVEICDQLDAERVRADVYHRTVEAAESQLDRR